MSFFIGEIYYALDSPIDGAAGFAQQYWKDNRVEIPGYTLPVVHGGLLRSESKAVLKEYVELVKNGPLVEFSKSLIAL